MNAAQLEIAKRIYEEFENKGYVSFGRTSTDSVLLDGTFDLNDLRRIVEALEAIMLMD